MRNRNTTYTNQALTLFRSLRSEENCMCPIYDEEGDLLETVCTVRVDTDTPGNSFKLLVTKDLIDVFEKKMRQFCHDVTSLTTLSLDSCEGESELWTRCKPDDLIGVSNLAEANAICDVKKLFKSIYDGCESRRQIEQDSQLYQILFGAIATAMVEFVVCG